ncbi:hypothetical protein T459_28853 [Capsicum annuum]|uniref:Cytochrome c domain-containing protein n=1 Tax=Capsicum annuum TaxID=4072 RepID=A0A2G2YI06_CAPAN|nr:hypothetical protein T459_28853 [Capsicum annuum]
MVTEIYIHDVDDVLVVVGDAISCDGGMVISTDTVASVTDGDGKGGDAGDSGVVVLVLIVELVGSRDQPVAFDGGSIGGRGVHGSIWMTLNKWRNVGIHGRNFIPITLLYLDDKSQIKDSVRMAEIGLTLAWMLDDFKVAIAKYISSPPMSATNLKVLHKMSGLSAKALVVLPCYISLEVGQFVIAKLATRSGSGKENFTDLSKSPHSHSKKVHPKKSGRDSSQGLSVPVLIQTIRRLTKEKVEQDSRTQRLETEKNELQSILEKELDRRSSDWSLKLEKYQIEQYRLRERARELAEQNVSLQRKFSSFNEKEVDNTIRITCTYLIPSKTVLESSMLKDAICGYFFCEEVALEVYRNSTCGTTENVGTAAKPNGIMHKPVHADRPNAFSNNNSSVLSCIQTAVDISSQIVGPSTFELPDHALVGPGREVRPKILSLHIQPPFLTLETDRAAVENVFNLKGIRALHLGLLYVGSLVVLLVYSILYGLTAKESNWLRATTSPAVIILDPLAARRDALQNTVIRLSEGFHRKDQTSSASSSEGCGSSVKYSSSADAGHLGNATVPCTSDGSTWNNIEGVNSDKSIDNGRPSLALHCSSCHSVVQEPELLDLNLALPFQEKLSDPRITSMLKQKETYIDRELDNLLQDKEIYPKFAVMLKENGLDPMSILVAEK